MACRYLLLELVLRPRHAGPAEIEPQAANPLLASTGYRLAGAYAIEMDEALRRHRSHRLVVRDLDLHKLPRNRLSPPVAPPVGASFGSTSEPSAPVAGNFATALQSPGDDASKELGREVFENELGLLARVLSLVEEAGCLVTAQGRRLEVPVLEALALRHDLALRGHFPLEEPYAARRSPYNPNGHLDLSFFLADGDHRLRRLPPELIFSLAFPRAERPLARDLATDDLAAARERALRTYLLLLRVQELRGKLTAAEAARRKTELVAGLSQTQLALVRQSEIRDQPTSAPTWLDQTGEGFLAFDIETALDLELLSRCAGRTVTLETSPDALRELLGDPTEFAPAPFHKVIALAMVFWDGEENGQVELERLVVGGHSRLGAPLPDEASLLTSFWRVAAGKRLLSYNGKRFDLPVLLYRALPLPISCGWYLEEKRPSYEQYRHPQSLRQLDVFEQLSGGLSPGKLGDLLQTVGLPGKQGTTGGDVEALWAVGDLETLGDYCLSDAAQTFLLALRFMGIAGHIDRARAGNAIVLARSRFEREPALARMLAGAGPEFFGEIAPGSTEVGPRPF